MSSLQEFVASFYDDEDQHLKKLESVIASNAGCLEDDKLDALLRKRQYLMAIASVYVKNYDTVQYKFARQVLKEFQNKDMQKCMCIDNIGHHENLVLTLLFYTLYPKGTYQEEVKSLRKQLAGKDDLLPIEPARKERAQILKECFGEIWYDLYADGVEFQYVCETLLRERPAFIHLENKITTKISMLPTLK